MKPLELISIYENFCQQTNGLDQIFDNSGMINEYKKLDFGFFPLGSGVFKSPSDFENAALPECRVMVLGNDFGSLDYLNNMCIDGRENKNNPTLRNLNLLKLDENTTFYTNLFMGVRKQNGNTEKIQHTPDFEKFSFDFFEMQLDYAKPKIVLCLGANVAKCLAKKYDALVNFTKPMKDLYGENSNREFVAFHNNIKYVLMPHPSFAHINWSIHNVADIIAEELV